MANVYMAILGLAILVISGCAVFGAIDYINTLRWVDEQEKYLREMEKNKA